MKEVEELPGTFVATLERPVASQRFQPLIRFVEKEHHRMEAITQQNKVRGQEVEQSHGFDNVARCLAPGDTAVSK